MTSRVRRAGQRFTFPAGLCGVASPALPDEQKPGGSTCLRCQLKPPAHGQRDRLLRCGDDQPDRAGAEGFLDRPQQIRFAAGLNQMQTLRNAAWQGTRHRQITIMSEYDPDDWPGKPHSLKQREARPVPALGLMNATVQQMKRISIFVEVPVTQDLHGCPP